jgi:hypothetical protein
MKIFQKLLIEQIFMQEKKSYNEYFVSQATIEFAVQYLQIVNCKF